MKKSINKQKVLRIFIISILLIINISIHKEAYATKTDWIEKMKVGYPNYMCDMNLFLDLSKFTKNKWLKLLKPATALCLEGYSESMPSMMPKEKGAFWGSKVGECVIKILEALTEQTSQ